YVPSPAVNMPSPVCEISRVAKSLRKPGLASTVRRSPMNDRAAAGAAAGSLVTRSDYRPGAAPRPGRDRGIRGCLPCEFAADELLDGLACVFVAVLLGRRLHEVRRSRDNRAADAAVLGDLRGANRIDDHAGRVRRVPDLELVLQVQRGVTERLAL